MIRLRPDLLRYAPDVAARFSLHAAQADELEREKAALLSEGPERDAPEMTVEDAPADANPREEIEMRSNLPRGDKTGATAAHKPEKLKKR